MCIQRLTLVVQYKSFTNGIVCSMLNVAFWMLRRESKSTLGLGQSLVGLNYQVTPAIIAIGYVFLKVLFITFFKTYVLPLCKNSKYFRVVV